MEGDACYTPKHHIMFHLIFNVGYQGNPRMYATWVDESLNKTLKACCRQVSQSTFEGSVLFHMRQVLRKGSLKRPLA
jgi:hypothetical protein